MGSHFQGTQFNIDDCFPFQRYAIVNMLQSKRFVFLWTSNTLILGVFTILPNHCFVWSTFFFPFVDFSIRKILFFTAVYTDTDDNGRYLPLSNIWTNGVFRYTLVFHLHIIYVFSVFMFFCSCRFLRRNWHKINLLFL